ncbi:MAG: glycosyl hydrolase family 28 protein [Candidatus Pedobacter colombiensis]|uniref:Glycosyl hydrolase family 28 protein n=1 Tax=Candidatus Pedobacter colombiensis TaxID=3121371 RepID=A0AAJ5WBG2_9SPHI|nr:glycosyl hydrolase family 28 protein [Pedobacter sp.]WEK21384.1 MAG: glycosyl hydrolase family 28 protein [Pedobacter sp.]
MRTISLLIIILLNSIHSIAQAPSNHSFFTVKANGTTLETTVFKDVNYASFKQRTALNIEITCSETIRDFVISPLNKQITGSLTKPNTLAFQLKEASYLVITINKNQRLFLFAETTEDQDLSGQMANINSYHLDMEKINTGIIQTAINQAAQKKQTLFFPSGVYKTGKLSIPSNSRILMAAGAVWKASDELSDLKNQTTQKPNAFIRIQDANHVEIKGLGVIDGNGRALRDKYGDDARFRIFLIVSSKDVLIEGITARDPGSWNTQIMYSDNVTFKKVKLLNDVTLSNTDGFDPDASSHVTIENCFAYTGDDNVAIKVTKNDGPVNRTSDITVKGCVFLTRKSSLKVGTESRGTSISNVLFEDNDVVMSDRGMALYCSDGALYQNIRYVNNRFESNYPDAKKMGIQFVINKRNADSKAGKMENVSITNCKFYTPFPAASEIKGLDDAHQIAVKIDNLEINGKKCLTLSDAAIKTTFATVEVK